MSEISFNPLIEKYRGALDTVKEGQARRERVSARYRNGKAHKYTMKMHEGSWAEGATANRELMKAAQREAHAIEKAALHPEQASADLLAQAAVWQERFAGYKATKNPGDRQYATLYTFTYVHLYRELKAGRVIDRVKAATEAKKALYQTVLPQIQSLISGEPDLIANMANIVAVLHSTFRFWWTGFYIVKEKEKSSILDHKSQMTSELVLGPFQGPVACTRIPYGKGVCGKAWAQAQTLIVPNVHEFPGHIACSAASKSEIVVPIRRNNDPDGEIIAVLDIDSADYNTFDLIDKKYLEQISLG